MSVIRIASRYAKSLLDLAVESNSVDTVLANVEHFSESVKNRDLYLLVKSPIVKTSKKEEIFKILFGDKYDKLTNAFLTIILKKGREAYLPEIAKEFLAQYKKYKGISSVKLTTATELSEQNLEAIKAKLLSSEITDENLDLETVVDPEIIGGFVLNIGDKLYDASIQHKLEKLRKSFSDNKYVSKL